MEIEFIPTKDNKYFRREPDTSYYILLNFKKRIYKYKDIKEIFGKENIKKIKDLKGFKPDGIMRIYTVEVDGNKYYEYTKYKLYEKFAYEIGKKYNIDKSNYDKYGDIKKIKLELVGFMYGKYTIKDVEFVIKKYIEKKDIKYINPQYEKRMMKIEENFNIEHTENYDWTIKYFDKIIEFIESYENLNTQKAYMVALTYVIGHYVENSNKYYEICSEKMVELTKKLQDIYDEQKILDNRLENMLLYEDLIRLREKYKEYNNESIKLHYQYLILCLYTMQPCLRSEYKDMKILQITNEKIPKDNNNYINICRDGNIYICINDDKTTYSNGREMIEILDDELKEIIVKSIKTYGRKYLITKINNTEEPSDKEFSIMINDIFSPLKFGIDMFRSAYVNNIYNKYNNKTLKKIAKMMRTSFYAMTTHYNKFFGDENGKDIIKKLKQNYKKIPNIDLDNKNKLTNIQSKKNNEEYYKKNQELINNNAKKYYEKNKESIKIKRNNICDEERERIRCQDYLRKLNKNCIKPTKKTLDKYNIFFNDETDKYEIKK